MAEQENYNPYAPPRPDVAHGAWQGAPAAPIAMPTVADALRRLQEHVANPANLANDRRVQGRRVPIVAYTIGTLGALLTVGAIVTLATADGDNPGPVLLLAGLVFLVLGAVILGRYLSLVRRDLPATPAKTASSFLRSLALGCNGYAWSCLAPTAREQSVFVPNLAPVTTVLGIHTLRGEPEMKAYCLAFARPSGPTMRTMAVKNVVEWPIQGDVTRVTAELHFTSWPRWVTILLAVGSITCLPVGLVGLVVFTTTRKRHKARVTKTLLRAQNGVWYVYDANVFEDGVAI